MRSLEFRLEGGDRNFGTAWLPASGGAHPLAIYCHGWGDSRALGDVQRDLAERLVARNAGLLTFDFFGAGDTGGDFSGMTYGRWTRNLVEVYAWTAAQAWADPRRLACIGFSSGTTAALRFAAASPGPLCVVSIATCLGHFINMADGGPARTLLANLDALSAGGTAPVFSTPFPLDFYRDFLKEAPVHTVQDVPCPVLFLEGGADNPYRRSDGRLGHLIRQRHGRPSMHHEVEGGDHGLFNKGEERNGRVMAFLQDSGLFKV